MTAIHIGIDRLHGKEIARGDLLERRGVEHEIDVLHDFIDTLTIAHVADMKRKSGIIQLDPHLFLLQLVTAEDPDLLWIAGQKHLDEGPAERSRAPSNQDRFPFQHITHEYRPLSRDSEG